MDARVCSLICFSSPRLLLLTSGFLTEHENLTLLYIFYIISQYKNIIYIYTYVACRNQELTQFYSGIQTRTGSTTDVAGHCAALNHSQETRPVF